MIQFDKFFFQMGWNHHLNQHLGNDFKFQICSVQTTGLKMCVCVCFLFVPLVFLTHGFHGWKEMLFFLVAEITFLLMTCGPTNGVTASLTKLNNAEHLNKSHLCPKVGTLPHNISSEYVALPRNRPQKENRCSFPALTFQIFWSPRSARDLFSSCNCGRR